MKIFFDTEFLEDGKTIDLISIALVREDGEHYYAVSREFDLDAAKNNVWVAENVLPQILYVSVNYPFWKTRNEIAEDIKSFVGPNPEFWADYCSYDWVALCQLYGTMMDLPEG